MDLADGDQVPGSRIAVVSSLRRSLVRFSECAQKRGAIPSDCCFGVVFGEAEIQVTLTVDTGESARAARKTMHQPGQPAQRFGTQDFWFGPIGGNGRHCIMLLEDTVVPGVCAIICA